MAWQSCWSCGWGSL